MVVHRSRQNTERRRRGAGYIFITIMRPLFRVVWNVRRQGERRKGKGDFTGRRLTLGHHAYSRLESKQNCMVGGTLCTHATLGARPVEITPRNNFLFRRLSGERAISEPERSFIEISRETAQLSCGAERCIKVDFLFRFERSSINALLYRCTRRFALTWSSSLPRDRVSGN